jgi:hypothetical protein
MSATSQARSFTWRMMRPHARLLNQFGVWVNPLHLLDA